MKKIKIKAYLNISLQSFKYLIIYTYDVVGTYGIPISYFNNIPIINIDILIS